MIRPGDIFESFYLFLLLASLGDIVVERSGVLNLGVDGFIVFSIALSYTASLALNPLTAMFMVLVCGVLYALLISLFVNLLHTSHVLTGLVLNMAFYGLSVIVGELGYDIAFQKNVPRTLTPPIVMGWQHVLFISITLAMSIWLLMYRTRIGVVIRACGFNPRATDSLGVRIWRARTLALVLGYIFIALGGFTYTMFYKMSWSPYIGMGYGFLAIALAMTSLWHPLIVLAPVALFSYLERSLYVFQLERGIPPPLLNMVPYAAAIVFITAVTTSPIGRRLPIPRALGEVYFKEERAA